METPVANVTHIAQFYAFVAIDRRGFPVTEFRRASKRQRIIAIPTKERPHSLMVQGLWVARKCSDGTP